MADYTETSNEKPRDEWKYWDDELKRAEKNLKKFTERGNKALEKFLDERGTAAGNFLNLYNSNICTLRAFLFGNAPKTDVSRRYADANDDVARVAAEILSRMINNDVEDSGNDFSSVLQCALDDRLIPGLGVARVRYVLDLGQRDVDPYEDDEGKTQTTEEYMKTEKAAVEYAHWRDVLWGYCRTWKDMPWMAFRTYPTKDQVEKRFGKEIAGELQYAEKSPAGKGSVSFNDVKDSEETTEIWEIYCKESLQCHWWNKDYKKMLETKDDFLQLQGFWPTPMWMMANTTTTFLQPIPDYFFAADIYEDTDDLYNRICILQDAVKAVGVYDESAEGVKRMFKEGVENDLIPVKEWARFSEKGGLEGAIDWMPIEAIVDALTQLRDLLREKIQLLYQVTGLSDILRGQATDGQASAAEQKLKARFGSIRIQSFQDQFAKFASGLAALKAEVICKHYQDDTILKESNIAASEEDPQVIQAALQLLRDWDSTQWRIEIKPESVAMTDYAQLQSERTGYLTALATFMQSAQPLAEMSADAVPVMLEMLKWGLAGFKGSNQIEGVLDRAIESFKKAPPQGQQPDPKTQQIQAQAQADAQKGQLEMAKEDQKHGHKMQQLTVGHEQELERIATESQASSKEIAEDTLGDIAKTKESTAGNIKQSAVKGLIDIAKQEHKGEMDSKKKSSVRSDSR